LLSLRNKDVDGKEDKAAASPPGKSLISCPAPFAKRFLFSPDPNQIYNLRCPDPKEGRFAIVTDVGQGCGGRGSVGRATGSQGGFCRE
jgi:hypothetical protein